VWVASSSTAICLPLLTWIINVFIGNGVISWVLVGAFAVASFLWMYRNMLKAPAEQEARSGSGAFGSGGEPVPPSSRING
jgi:hypothetical protein